MGDISMGSITSGAMNSAITMKSTAGRYEKNRDGGIVALYIRLSREDEDIGDEKLESNSITNQRALLYDFLDEHPDLKAYEAVEFVDGCIKIGLNQEHPYQQGGAGLVLFYSLNKKEAKK